MVVEMDEATREQVREMFETLENDVIIHLFTEGEKCLYCNDTRDLVKLVAELSDTIKILEHKGPLDTDLAKKLGVTHHPAIVLEGKEEYKIKFYGIPAGHEFGAFIGSIIDVSHGTPSLPQEIVEDINSIDKPIHIRVFVTPQCPYCPGMTRLAFGAAMINPLIDAEVFESLEMQQEAVKYQVFGVPKTIFNETTSVEGLTPPEMFVEKLFESIE
jgi:glutaredoxin-like protein